MRAVFRFVLPMHGQVTEIAQATATAAENDITKLRWKEGKEVPERMTREAAVVDGNTVYINSGGFCKVYSCQIQGARGDQGDKGVKGDLGYREIRDTRESRETWDTRESREIRDTRESGGIYQGVKGEQE